MRWHTPTCLVHLFRPNGLGTSAKASGKGYAAPMQGEDFYTADEAARILRLTPGRIRQMLRTGELEGIAKRRLLPPGRGRQACSELAGA
jgi:hypothetical protein